MATIAELQEALKFENYRRFLKIEDLRTGKLVTFEPNSVQRRIRAEIVSSLRAKQPVRIIILKSRRMGVSTVIQATFAHTAFVTRRFSAVTGAHLDESSEYLHGMTEQMYEGLPEALKQTKKTGLRGKRIAFTSGSSLRTFTAGGRSGVGRGTGTRAIHASEVAYWPDARSTLLALRQIVPNEPGTFVILESTAHGVGDTFHEEWQRACDGRSEYTPLFFAWYEFENYQTPGGKLDDLDDDELALVRLGVTDQQLAWRRHTIANECGGSLDMFHQEYPATPEEAFLSSGRPFFTGLDKLVAVGPMRGDLDGIPVKGGGRLRFLASPGGPVSIWKSARATRRYVIGADVAGSVILAEHTARVANDKPSSDAYCAYCVDTQTGELVASLYGRGWTEFEYALKLAQLGRLYNDADIAVEKNGGFGNATILQLRDKYAYPRIYTHQDEDSTSPADETGAYGFPMSSTTRPLVLADLSEALRDRPSTLRDAELVREMRTFVWNDRGRPEADTGAHDDRVMSMAITQHVRNLRATKPIRMGERPVSKRSAVTPIAKRAPRFKDER